MMISTKIVNIKNNAVNRKKYIWMNNTHDVFSFIFNIRMCWSISCSFFFSFRSLS